VGVAGNDDGAVVIGKLHEGTLETAHERIERVALGAQIEAEIEGHLVVARAGCVELGAGLANAARELALNVHVDVLELGLELECARFDLGADPAQAGDDLFAFLGRNQAGGLQRCGVRDGPLDIVPPEPPVETDGFAIAEEKVGGGCGKAAVPHWEFSISDFRFSIGGWAPRRM
jgi:hypothetical protein